MYDKSSRISTWQVAYSTLTFASIFANEAFSEGVRSPCGIDQ
jgi:hypothetical protein